MTILSKHSFLNLISRIKLIKKIFNFKTNIIGIAMKNDLDSSEIMANFNKHRTQVAIDNFVNDSVKIKISNINFNSLLVEAKESIMQELKKEKNVKLEKECKINVEKLKTDLNKQAVEIKKQKEEIAKQTNQINLQNAQINKQTNRISEQQKKIFFKIVILLIFVLRV